MKKVIFFCLAACFFFFACEKDEGVLITKVTKDIYVELTAHPNMDLPQIQCMPMDQGWQFVPGGGWLTGEVSEIGALEKESSPYTMLSCEFGPGENQITEKMDIRMGDSKGDYLAADGSFTLTMTPDGPPVFEGGVTIKGGTGKFVGTSGRIQIDPNSVVFNPEQGTLSWTGSGQIAYPN